MKNALVSALSILLVANPAFAEICDYRPSELIGGVGAGATVATGGAVAAGGVAAKAAGIYTLVHASSGLTMLASTAGGASAAGTVGIMGGTAGALGTVGAVVTAPATIIAGIVIAVGVGGYEGLCYFSDERVTDYPTVLERMKLVASTASHDQFRLIEENEPGERAAIMMRNEEGTFDIYQVKDLYIVNNTLMHRDWGPNTRLGSLGFFIPQTDPALDGN
ncbi:hypothetical protein SAMN05877809_109152 [Rhodobacter sp. JA431]|uniref:hypothetical protein n=1 Tax=Rhodobacter sp. JA431 TaxID=570013 RepID=UPI000BC9CF2E|nr:hypothetical protein [Rhodobacter sp. JA431]SOC17735.1 hypothetical protein SAMN05877809_109152 [Rhodobacter sp. JA431]